MAPVLFAVACGVIAVVPAIGAVLTGGAEKVLRDVPFLGYDLLGFALGLVGLRVHAFLVTSMFAVMFFVVFCVEFVVAEVFLGVPETTLSAVACLMVKSMCEVLQEPHLRRPSM